MDLLQSVRKEGSRGGVDFKWEDVRTSQHRENYLGHSLMAPVGRWQKGRDLNWYAKAGDGEKTAEELEAEERERRKEELRKVKEAEEDAMAKALGLPVPDRSANTEPLGESKISQRDVTAVIKDSLDDDVDQQRTITRSSRDDGRPRDRHERKLEAAIVGIDTKADSVRGQENTGGIDQPVAMVAKTIEHGHDTRITGMGADEVDKDLDRHTKREIRGDMTIDEETMTAFLASNPR